MRIRTISTLTVVGVLALLPLSCAHEASRRQLAEELLLLMEVNKTMEKSYGLMKQMQMDQVKSMKLPEELPKEDLEAIASLQGRIMDIIAEELGWDKLKEGYIDIYADTFTQEELAAPIAFYRTPAGQKFIEKQPALLQKSMEISQEQMASIMPKIQKAQEDMKAALQELKEKSDS